MRKIRLDIDLLKTIAIIAVILYHFFDIQKVGSTNFSFTFFDGGFLGVDVFLVISGFLITGSVLGKLTSNEFSLVSFYTKRVTRIYPPLIVVCLFVAVFGYFLLLPDIYQESTIETVNAIIGIANFRFANSGGYFSLASADKALLHTWYIAITIQFYILCPIILLAFNKIFKAKLKYALLAFTVLLICIAPKFCVAGKGYLLTQCRIWEMFVGATLFLFKDDIYNKVFKDNDKLSKAAFYVGLLGVVLSIMCVRLSYGEYYVYTSALTVLATALVILANNQDSFLLNSYTTAPGKCSYSLYLWHWPLFVFAFQCNFDLSALNVLAEIVVLIALTFVSYKLLEKKQVSKVFTLLCLVAVATNYMYVKKGPGESYLQQYLIETLKDRTFAHYKNESSPYLSEGEFTVFKYVANNEKPTRFIIGDSHTGHYREFFLNDYDHSTYFLSIAATMAFGELSANYKTTLPPPLNVYPEQRKTFFSLYKTMLDKLDDGSKVLLACNWHVHYEIFIRENNIEKNNENYHKYINAVISDIDSQVVKHPNLKFYIVGQNAYISRKDMQCTKLDLSNSFLKHIIAQGDCKTFKNDIEEKNYLMNKGLSEYAASRDNVVFVDRNVPLLRENNRILGFDDNHYPIYNDDHHYTYVGAKMVGEYIMSIVDKE